MDIRDIRRSLAGVDNARTETSTLSAKAAEKLQNAEKPANVDDRIDLSTAGTPTAPADEHARTMAFARAALLGIPPLSDEKMAEVRERIKSNHYLTPEISQDVSEKIASGLNGQV
jgi:hypothetical protein